MHPRLHAEKTPEKTAYLMSTSGERVSYRQLEERANRCAQLLRSLGLRDGDGIALFLVNGPRYFEPCWAAQRAGLYYTPLSTHLTAGEVAYIAKDCGARVLIASRELGDVAAQLAERLPGLRARLMVGGSVPGFESYEEAVAAQPAHPIADEREGQDMLYSSGTTGHPKGIRVPLPDRAVGDPDPMAIGMTQGMWSATPEDVYLSPAPLYHSAPLRCTMALQRVGATCVVMERFDPERALALIEEHRVTLSQWVPTMFVRMLKLPAAVRRRYDLASHRSAVHAAAPCPVPVKEQMLAWWGPIIHEYYAATENNGSTAIGPEEWLAHKGSVGKPIGVKIHIVDDDGRDLPPGEIGAVYFEGGGRFQYHNDPAKTADCYTQQGWSTVGDVGYADDEGYLYLTDRKSNMIISGGVNIYPQEAENVLITHPKVADVAVFGIPHEEFGEEVKAVVQPVARADAGPALENELLEFCREQLAKLKCPRSVDFQAELPRHPTGKLYKRLLKDRYWGKHDSRIV